MSFYYIVTTGMFRPLMWLYSGWREHEYKYSSNTHNCNKITLTNPSAFVGPFKKLYHHHHHHHISVMELGHLLTRSGLTYPEVSSKVCHDSFCQLGNSVSLSWVIYYMLYPVSLIPVICLKFVLFLIKKLYTSD